MDTIYTNFKLGTKIKFEYHDSKFSGKVTGFSMLHNEIIISVLLENTGVNVAFKYIKMFNVEQTENQTGETK